MKPYIVLVYPQITFEANYPCSWIPYSILAIASALPKEKYNVVLFDENRKTISEFERLLHSISAPICIGFSIMTGGGQINNALALARIARNTYPETPIVFGGPHVNVLPEETLNNPLIDYTLVGPGQSSFPVLIRALCGECSFIEVPGLFGKKGNSIIHGGSNHLTQSTIVPYDFGYINIEDYIQPDLTISDKTVNYISTQGCVYKCKFCYETNYKRRYGKMPCENVISDIELFVDKYGVNGIKFYDADWFIDSNRTTILVDALNNYRIHWAASIHPKDVLRAIERKEPLLEKIAKSGCRRLLMGIESGCNRVLREVVDKGVTKEETLFVAKQISEYGILGSYTFIVGFPGESIEEQNETFDFITKLWELSPRPETRVHIYTPYPGTPLYEEAIKQGFIPPQELSGWSDFDYFKAMMPWTDKELEQRVKHFTNMIPKK